MSVASKEGLGERVEGLAESAPTLGSAGMPVPSHEGHGAHPIAPAGHTGKHHHHKHPDFEERTYQLARGAETPDGLLEKLHLHHDHGDESQPLIIKEPPAEHPGSMATPSDVDRPIKLQGHNYRHEKPEQQEAGTEEGQLKCAPTRGVDASHMAMEAGGEAGGELPGMKCHEGECSGGEEHVEHMCRGAAHPAGAYATPSEEDPPIKLMPHHREEEGVEAHRHSGAGCC